MNRRGNTALVFSGGGARGAYQIGMWKAMRELSQEGTIKAVYGTSVGAINAAAYIQGDLGLAEELWRQLHYDKVFNNVPLKGSTRFSRSFVTFARQAIKEKGLDVTPLKTLLRSSLSEEKIRSSNLDYGLVVFDWTKKKPKYLTKKQIPEGELIEYIIASSTFPMFQPHHINGQVYIDGGVYDNRPLNFCSNSKNIDHIICVDVTIARHFWPNKRRKLKDKILFVRPSRLLGSPMAFDIERIERNIDLGYNDGLIQLHSD